MGTKTKTLILILVISGVLFIKTPDPVIPLIVKSETTGF